MIASSDHQILRVLVADLTTDVWCCLQLLSQIQQGSSLLLADCFASIASQSLDCAHPLLLQLTYEGETAIASQPFVSRAFLDGMEVTATAIAWT